MKTYKLIQTYPESPPISTEITESRLGAGQLLFTTYTIKGGSKNCDGGKFKIDNPWLYSKNWEEVIEPTITYPVGTQAFDSAIPDSLLTKTADGWYNTSKTSYTDKIVSQRKNITILKPDDKKDYEILSFKDMLNNLITKKEGKFLTSYHETEYKEERLIKKCEIHSVKRLSDEKVFTVDDNIEDKGLLYWVITGFTVIDNFIKIDGKRDYNTTETISHTLRGAKHCKKPLFTTEDVVNIFEGDEYWIVSKKVTNHTSAYLNKAGSKAPIIPNYFSFKSKEAAEEYILLNISKLCINDIMDVTDTNNEMALKDFKKLVKKKIDGN
jgi:hypothetical protein